MQIFMRMHWNGVIKLINSQTMCFYFFETKLRLELQVVAYNYIAQTQN